MKNVYDAVWHFYEQDAAWEDILKYEWVEGFLRQKAWQHTDDVRLRAIWQQILMFELYLAYADVPLPDMQLGDYGEMVGWLERNVAEFSLELPAVKSFFQTLMDFEKYLVGRKIIKPSATMMEAAKYITGGKKLRLVDGPGNEIKKIPLAFATPDAPAPIYIKLDEHLQELLLLLNEFYQKSEFIVDFERAIFLYHGIMGWDEDELDSQKQEFWLGFWDYFLFDYRLISNDKTPLRHFYDTGNYPAETRSLLKELVSARFAVFFMKNLSDEDWLECEDLLTGQTFFLPNPGEHAQTLKDLLFMGHLFSHNMVLVNYVMSVPVSLNLRKRIKEEIIKQFSFYRVQEPGADWDCFYRRHAIAVRHAIDIFTTFSKLNAVVDVDVPDVGKKSSNIGDTRVIEILVQAMKSNVFSFNDQQLAIRMWLDYCYVSYPVAVRKPQNWAAGLVANFALINSAFVVDYDYIGNMFNVPVNSVREYGNKIARALELQEHDLRYLNEEGFIMLLMK